MERQVSDQRLKKEIKFKSQEASSKARKQVQKPESKFKSQKEKSKARKQVQKPEREVKSQKAKSENIRKQKYSISNNIKNIINEKLLLYDQERLYHIDMV